MRGREARIFDHNFGVFDGCLLKVVRWPEILGLEVGQVNEGSELERPLKAGC
jgi:hypothetical protein